MKILNLGVGNCPIKGTIGVDMKINKYVDEVLDLNKTPWKWKEEEIDGIYMIHSLEHFKDNLSILSECYRVLKPGGFLYVEAPHASSSYALADLGHHSCYALSTLSRLDGSGYMEIQWFETKLKRIFYLFQPRNHKHPYVPFLLDESKTGHPFLRAIGLPFASIIQLLIDLNPLLFERFWGNLVGGAEEMVWMGIKI
jgi:SAM-dependent methyltransferase